MKKYYLIYAAIGIGFLICCAAVFLNANVLNRFLPGHSEDEVITSSTAGDIAVIILIAIVVLIVVARIVYLLYKYIRKLWLRVHNKKDDRDYTPDSFEFYTDKNSPENMLTFLISTRNGRLDKDFLEENEENRK